MRLQRKTGTGFKPRRAAMLGFLGTTWLWQESRPLGFGVLPFAMWLRQQERLPRRKGEKGLLLVGHEKVPHGSGLTGDHGGDTADGARTEGSLNHGLLLLFLR